MHCRLAFLLFIAQCAFGEITKLSEADQIKYMRRTIDDTKRLAEKANYTKLSFDAALESKVLKMACDDLESQLGARFFDAKHVTNEIAKIDGVTRIACIKTDCIYEAILPAVTIKYMCAFGYPEETTTVSSASFGTQRIVGCFFGILVFAVFNYFNL
ncbi:Conserved secreted protein [Caenorhabditis elegans]|uniref:Conserved secreted protein n=1 Tax=Caenorhabditis elegans TaxID=6239 RepID=O16576_CAEEL|nr:Conserved secreted protein [Caenorhabditis elegans]CCD66451.1 Conserved secreted protein [Caenorhabditis elegans]|eukprot:NP_494203.2 Uncharacterized protein CELE_C33C12.4 [Caenorhabditis elegans]